MCFLMTIYNYSVKVLKKSVILTSISHFLTSTRVGNSNMSNMKLYNHIIKNAATKKHVKVTILVLIFFHFRLTHFILIQIV